MTDHVTDRLYLAGRVERYATWPTIHKQTVGEHCWQIYNIHCQIFGTPDPGVAYTIMNHDSAELIVGDPPFPIKANNPDLKAAYTRIEPEAEKRLGVKLPALDANDKVRIKVCDLLEMFIFGIVEREMGNVLASPVVMRTRDAALALSYEMLPPDDHASVVLFTEAEIRAHDKRMFQLKRMSDED
jgi:hypothetical protein